MDGEKYHYRFHCQDLLVDLKEDSKFFLVSVHVVKAGIDLLWNGVLYIMVLQYVVLNILFKIPIDSYLWFLHYMKQISHSVAERE